jgi:hypothetical protein
MLRVVHSCLLIVGTLLLGLGEARAESSPPSVKIDLLVIAGTMGTGGVDPKLEKIRKRLSDFKYSTYQLLSEQTLALSVNAPQTVPLPDKYTLEVTTLKIEPSGMIRIHLHVHGENQRKLVDTEYAIAPGGDLLVGGMKHEGGALMVALHHHGEK